MIRYKEFEDQLIRHEGLRLKMYVDTVGKTSIGVGRNLDDVGISEEEAMFLLGNDIEEKEKQLNAALPWVINLDRPRYYVLANMCFNMGIGNLLLFEKMLRFVEEGNYRKASVEMLNSKWSSQVGNRAKELAKQMETGKW